MLQFLIDDRQQRAVDGHPHVILGSPIDNDDFGSTPDDPTKTSNFVGSLEKEFVYYRIKSSLSSQFGHLIAENIAFFCEWQE